MEPVKMYDRKRKFQCDVYEIEFQSMQALTFSAERMMKNNGGSGWEKVPLKQLVPVEYACDYTEYGFISKSKKNHYKSHLKLTSAVWESSDGERFEHLDDAVKHQAELEGDVFSSNESGSEEES